MSRYIGLSTILLWPAAALALIALLGSLILIVPHDFWWHLKIGEVISRDYRIPTVDHYSFTRAGAPFVYQSWLSELILYLIYQAGGLSLIVIVRNVLLVATYAILAWQAYRRSGSWRLAALGVLAAAAVAFNNWTIRPQSFSWLPFAICWTVLAGYSEGWLSRRWLVALPAIELVWANLHGAFILGLALTALVAVGETLVGWFRLQTSGRNGSLRFETRNPVLRFIAPLWLTLAAMIAATLVNPYGPGLYSYVRTLLSNPSVRQLVIEWQPPSYKDPIGQLFFLSLASMLLLWIRFPAKRRLSDVLVLLAFTWLALGGIRNIIWYGMIAGPLLAEWLARPRATPRPQRRELVLQRRINLVLAVLLFMPAILVQPPFRSSAPIPTVFSGNTAPEPEAALVTPDTPLAATAYLRKHRVGDRLYHEMSYGSYLIWAFGGEIPVFADPRVELYPLSLWQDYRRIAQGCDYTALLEKYQIDALLLDRQRQARLLERLVDDTAWEKVYEDDHAVIYRRSGLSASQAGNCEEEPKP
ncbi:MAG: hypothetical protein KatS3mg057_0848 [Herpetosiphonaceae bacterium]|nr:MAG: hypothetical protein KatS3mg057_0848 [Herpetosiphonaceae bacterium]